MSNEPMQCQRCDHQAVVSHQHPTGDVYEVDIKENKVVVRTEVLCSQHVTKYFKLQGDYTWNQ